LQQEDTAAVHELCERTPQSLYAGRFVMQDEDRSTSHDGSSGTYLPVEGT
jgi:hypothetical protein